MATTFERAGTERRASWVTILGLILVPVIVAAGFVFATWQMGDRLDRVTAAVVNTDDGAEIDGQTVPLGRQLAAGLVDPDDDDDSGADSADNINWVLSDEEDSEDGLSTGTYAAVVTIPEGFSEAVTSSGEDDPMEAYQATLDVKSSAASPLADAAIAQAISQAATSQFNETWSQQYLDNMLMGFNDMGDQMEEMGDAAGDLADGAGELDDGVNEMGEGARELDDNGAQLTGGFGEMAGGVSGLAEGATGLSGGLNRFAGGIGELEDGADELAGGVSGLADGAGGLADGLDQMYSGSDGQPGAKELPEQTQELADGVSGLDDGADELSGGVAEYTRGVDDMLDGFTDGGDEGGPEELAEGARGVSDGIDQARGGFQDQSDTAAGIAEDPQSSSLDELAQQGLIAPDAVAGLQAQIDELCAGVDEQTCAGVEAMVVSAAASGSATGYGAAAEGMGAKDDPESLNGGADQVAGGVEELAAGMGELEDRAPELKEAGEGLREGSSGLAEGTGELAEGTQQLADGMGPLADGIGQSADGAGELADGADELAGGMDEFTGGIGELGDGASELADGASELAGGAGELAAGMGEYGAGLYQYTGGVTQIAEGIDELSDGTGGLADGTQEFADGVKDGADEVPSYTEDERDNLTDVVAQAVKGDGAGFGGLAQNATVALLVIMAMWIGALVTYTVLRAVPASALTSRGNSFGVMLRGLLPGLIVGVVQAVVLSILAVTVLDVPIFDFGTMLCLLLFVALTFTVLNFALTAWLGGFGRLVSVVLVVLAAASGIFSATPGWFDTLAPVLPLTPAMNGMTALAAGASGVGGAFGALLGWFVLGLAASFAAVVRSRVAGSAGLARLSRSGA